MCSTDNQSYYELLLPSSCLVKNSRRKGHKNYSLSKQLPSFSFTNSLRFLKVILAGLFYHTSQAFTGYIGSPFLQLKASPNFAKFCTAPKTRSLPGLCGFVNNCLVKASSENDPHQTWPKDKKKIVIKCE